MICKKHILDFIAQKSKYHNMIKFASTLIEKILFDIQQIFGRIIISFEKIFEILNSEYKIYLTKIVRKLLRIMNEF